MAEQPRKLTTSVVSGQPYKASLYDEFILWFAAPSPYKQKIGLETQKQFADYYGTSERNLSRWKERYDFEPRVRELRRKWGFEKTGAVIEGIYRSAVKGNPLSQKLWLQVFEGFAEKTEVEHTKKVEIGVNDIRFIIEGMPEPTRTKFYGYIREIIDEAVALRNAGELADGLREDDGAEAAVPGKADHDAQDASEPKADVLAGRHSASVCRDMVGLLSSGNYQGPARWGKE